MRRLRAAVVLGTAWPTCGSHEVYKRQLALLRDLGFRTYFLAVSDNLALDTRSPYWATYGAMTADIDADGRGVAAPRPASRLDLRQIAERRRARRRGVCHYHTLPARLAVLPRSLQAFLRAGPPTVIVCNHYFNMPLARRLRGRHPGARVLLETHDVWSRHFADNDTRNPLDPRLETFATMLAEEMTQCAFADLLIHLNGEEDALFRARLPGHRHALILPSLPRRHAAVAAIAAEFASDFLIVAADNRANCDSLRWLFDEVWSAALDSRFRLRIVGAIDIMFARDHPALFGRYRACFAGRVEDVAPFYRGTRRVLLPAVRGHGVSIKTIEALSYGKPILGMPLAVRGFADLAGAGDIAGIVASAAQFRCALDAPLPPAGTDPGAIALYERLFSPEAHRAGFAAALARAGVTPDFRDDSERGGDTPAAGDGCYLEARSR